MKKRTNKLSLNERVLAVLATKGTVTLADIRAALPDIKSSNISTALWVLKRGGKVEHDLDYGLYALTSVNKKAEAPKEEPKVAPVVKEKQLHIAQRDAKYWQERCEMHMDTITQLRQQHEEAVSIIRYLEGKLYIALQQGTKSGRNS